MRDDSAEILFQSFLRDNILCSSGMGRDVRSLTLSIQRFLCRPRSFPTLPGGLKNGFGEAVVACDML